GLGRLPYRNAASLDADGDAARTRRSYSLGDGHAHEAGNRHRTAAVGLGGPVARVACRNALVIGLLVGLVTARLVAVTVRFARDVAAQALTVAARLRFRRRRVTAVGGACRCLHRGR